jgi:hypothetical protein
MANNRESTTKLVENSMTRISRALRWSVKIFPVVALLSVPVTALRAEPEKIKYEVGFDGGCNWQCIWPPQCCPTN